MSRHHAAILHFSRLKGNLPAFRLFCGSRADVAQLVEQGFRKAKVGGSSPSVGTINQQ